MNVDLGLRRFYFYVCEPREEECFLVEKLVLGKREKVLVRIKDLEVVQAQLGVYGKAVKLNDLNGK